MTRSPSATGVSTTVRDLVPVRVEHPLKRLSVGFAEFGAETLVPNHNIVDSSAERSLHQGAIHPTMIGRL